METKEAIRKKAKAKRETFSREKVLSVSNTISKYLLEQEWYNNTREFFVYSAIKEEINLKEFIHETYKNGKKVSFPRVKDNEMDFFWVENEGNLQDGYFGIMEPDESCMKAEPGENSIIFVPGLAFSKEGQRVGYGKGFYDRYLSRYPGVKTIGICYSELIYPGWEQDSYDINVEKIITEKRGNRNE